MLGELGSLLDLGELIRRVVKYLVEGIMVAIAAYAIPKRSLNLDEVMLIALDCSSNLLHLGHLCPKYGSRCPLRSRFWYGSQSCWIPPYVNNSLV